LPHSAKSLAAVIASALLGLSIVTATAFALVIKGTPGDDHIQGSNTADRIIARAGNDTVDAGPGADRVFGNRGDDRLEGKAGPDRLHGNRGDDTLVGDVPLVGDTVSRDRLFGGRGNDTLRGGDGFDRLHGGPGADTANGNAGNDLMSGGTGDDAQDGGPGDDRIFANRGNDTTSGGPGNDILFALARRDVHGRADLSGDTIRGDAGDDRIRVRDGEQDTVNCGEGNDTAFLDLKDKIEDATNAQPNGSCEVVERHAPNRADSLEEDRTEEPAEDRQQG
jgi:Ca2+-binding RTX toxin-like protein